jgi:large subunit ribosomal protein L19
MAFDPIQHVETMHAKKRLPIFKVGDTVEVRVKILEGDKERIQPFVGTVICSKGSGIRRTFTVRRIVTGEGVERTFPLHSPFVTAVKVQKLGSVRRAKLYYLRDRVGKATRILEASAEDRARFEAATAEADLLEAEDTKKAQLSAESEPAAAPSSK